MAGKIASMPKKAMPPATWGMLSPVKSAQARQKMSFQPRKGISPGCWAARPRPGSSTLGGGGTGGAGQRLIGLATTKQVAPVDRLEDRRGSARAARTGSPPR